MTVSKNVSENSLFFEKNNIQLLIFLILCVFLMCDKVENLKKQSGMTDILETFLSLHTRKIGEICYVEYGVGEHLRGCDARDD